MSVLKWKSVPSITAKKALHTHSYQAAASVMRFLFSRFLLCIFLLIFPLISECVFPPVPSVPFLILFLSGFFFLLLTIFSVAISLYEEKTTLSKNNFHFLLPRASAVAGAGNVNLPNVSILRIYHLCIVKKKIRMVLISSQDF